MAVGAPTKIADVTAAATASFSAQTAGTLLVCHIRRNNSADNTAIGLSGWTEAAQATPGDSASSKERSACFYKVSDGTETSVSPTGMTGGTRAIEVYATAVPAGGGGTWKLLDAKTESSATPALVVGDGADVLTECTECLVFAQACYSSSVTAGNEGAWPAFHVRQTSNRFNGSTGTLLANGKGTFDSKFTWVTDTRRAAMTNAVFGYVKLATVAWNTPAAGAVTGIVSLVPTVTEVNTTVQEAQAWVDEATDRQIGTDTTSPYAVSWDTGPEAAGTYNVYWKAVLKQGAGESTSANRAFTKSGAATSNIKAIKYGNAGGTAWVDVTAVRVPNAGATAWVDAWP